MSLVSGAEMAEQATVPAPCCPWPGQCGWTDEKCEYHLLSGVCACSQSEKLGAYSQTVIFTQQSSRWGRGGVGRCGGLAPTGIGV